MNPIILIVLVTLAVTPAQAEPHRKKKQSGFDKFVQTIFPPKKQVPKKPAKAAKRTKPKVREVIVTTPPPTERRPKLVVDPEWMARYIEQEAVWDYEIPDDDLITFKDGKYHVPLVVFKHYEDMLATPRRTVVIPKSTPRPDFE